MADSRFADAVMQRGSARAADAADAVRDRVGEFVWIGVGEDGIDVVAWTSSVCGDVGTIDGTVENDLIEGRSDGYLAREG